MDFGHRLRDLRIKQGYTQEILAEKLELTRQSVSKWEAGQVLPEPETLMKISDIFNVSIDYLLKGTAPPAELCTPVVAGQNPAKKTSAVKVVLAVVAVVLLLLVVLAAAGILFFIFSTTSATTQTGQVEMLQTLLAAVPTAIM